MTNYEIMQCQMEKEFLKYDQEEMIRKFHLRHDSQYIYIKFIGRLYRITRSSGKVEWSDNDFVDCVEANYNEAMTIYDVLCYSKPDCHLAREFVNMKSLSSIQGGSATVGSSLFKKMEEFFDHKDKEMAKACEKLDGTKERRGDVAYQVPVFDFMSIVIRFWNSDEEFPASLQLFTDKHILDYMHYETVWFLTSHLLSRIREEM